MRQLELTILANMPQLTGLLDEKELQDFSVVLRLVPKLRLPCFEIPTVRPSYAARESAYQCEACSDASSSPVQTVSQGGENQRFPPEPGEPGSLRDDLRGLLPREHREVAAAGRRGREGIVTDGGAGVRGRERSEGEGRGGGVWGWCVCGPVPNGGGGCSDGGGGGEKRDGGVVRGGAALERGGAAAACCGRSEEGGAEVVRRVLEERGLYDAERRRAMRPFGGRLACC